LKYVYIVFIVLVFFGCTPKEPVPQTKVKVVEILDLNETVQDLIDIPQEISYYTKNIENKNIYKSQRNYEKAYFSMWNITKPAQTLENIKWPFKYFNADKNYAENLQPVEDVFFSDMLEESNFEEYSTVNKKALTI